MKKFLSFVFAVAMVCTVFTTKAFALDQAPSMGGYSQDAEGFSQCYSDYLEYYLFGISTDTRNLIKEQVRTDYADGTIDMMSLMTAFSNIRKAGQVAETTENQVNGVKPTIDVIHTYYALTQEQKTNFESFIVPAFSAIGLTVTITDGTVIIKKSSDHFAEIKLVNEKPKSSTRLYLDAYIPGLSDEEKNVIEALVAEYSAEGGSPAGSGAVWRCIREIGELMGVEATRNVDMASGVMDVTVTKEGETYLKNCSKDVQDAVIEKVKEALEAIGCTGEYTEGVFTIKKAGIVRLTHTIIENNNTNPVNNTPNNTNSEDTTSTTKNPDSSNRPKTGDSSNSVVISCFVGVSLASLLLATKKKMLRSIK